MPVSSGPNDETWKKMSPLAKKIYWVAVGVICAMVLAAVIVKLSN